MVDKSGFTFINHLLFHSKQPLYLFFSPERRAEVRFSSLKQEGNDFVKRSQYQEALAKYTECLKLKPEECAIYTNR